jgi:hypothetical protein
LEGILPAKYRVFKVEKAHFFPNNHIRVCGRNTCISGNKTIYVTRRLT